MTSERLHPVGVAVIAARRLRSWANFVLPALGVAVLGSVPMAVIVTGAAALVIVALVIGVAEWWRFTFGVDGDAVVVRRGIFQREVISVPVARIQALDVSQGAIARLIGMREVRVRVAGGGTRVRLVAISASAETALRAALGDRAGSAEEAVVRRLDSSDLVLLGLTSPFVVAGIAAFAGILDRLDDVLPGDLFGDLERAVEPSSVLIGFLEALALIVLALLASVVGAVLGYAGFRIVRAGPRLRLRRGLIQRHEIVLPVERVRTLLFAQNPPRELMGRGSIRARTAGRRGRGGVDAILFPLIRRTEAGDLVRETLPALDPDGIELHRLPPRARGRTIRRALWPWLVITAIAVAVAGVWGALVLAVLPFAAVLGWARFRAAGVGMAGRRLALVRRRVGRRTLIADARAVQWRTLRASPFQRRRGLATLEVGLVAGGEQEVRDLDSGDAGRLTAALDPRRLPKLREVA